MEHNAELDELKDKWAEHDRKLDTSIRLNRQLVREVYTNRARSALLRLALILGLGAVLLLAVIVSLGDFIYQNLGQPRFGLPAIALDVCAIAALGTLILQIVLSLQTDYERPVAAIQKRLERLRKVRIRYVQAIFLTAALLWVPMLIVGMKAFFGVDVYQTFDRAWLWSNVLFGLAIIPLGIWLARRYGDRISRSSYLRKLVNDLAGYNLNSATDLIATLARFEREEG